ncbi:uncharacterized protein LOC131025820 [Salvia miltiorrhiza]|uniref:uncharacterized protein LOC131025820 n=1 Tax=Salvia miltiorrhiza TaxID=226208 RepID=UPI0025ABE92B|nr:uncharacterized protein LOC131025820 [Salvia miltiorrhiza]
MPEEEFVPTDNEDMVDKEIAMEKPLKHIPEQKKEDVPEAEEKSKVVIKPHFPGRLAKNREAEEMSSLVKTFQKVEVNIPLLTTLHTMPKCAKFLKEICTKKVMYTNDAKFQVGEQVSAVLKRDMPTKCEDLGMFYTPCIIGDTKIEQAMLDLGASINVMPLIIYQELKIGPLKPTRVVIQLADMSSVYSEGIVDDVLVKVHDLIFPADFYVLNMGGSMAKPTVMLLGRPFLKTARAQIDCAIKKLTCQFD